MNLANILPISFLMMYLIHFILLLSLTELFASDDEDSENLDSNMPLRDISVNIVGKKGTRKNTRRKKGGSKVLL